ncbi:hypothetical protein BD309DRAFT_350148 [Dichomitus squalens]|uniref:Uncharacterized protein n=1 Tax=Dichomitus squalens TaxID=114155 RepID=A0A4Q9MFI7_9APHY|nr:hypothetical protein BD311DRAFT_461394 [Dichomitus squalens]TBU40404.1 hypothetical protein BD309DRAFT_350148 [Dichomitus squalens]
MWMPATGTSGQPAPLAVYRPAPYDDHSSHLPPMFASHAIPPVIPLRVSTSHIHRADAVSYAVIFLRPVLMALYTSQVCLVFMSPRSCGPDTLNL